MFNKCENPECCNYVKPKRRFCSYSCVGKTITKARGSPFSNPAVKEKIKNTNLKKYGVDNVFKLKSVQDKIVSKRDYKTSIPKTVATCKERHGEDFYRKKWKIYNQRNISPETLKKLESKEWLLEQHNKFCLSEIARQLNVSFTMVWAYARLHNLETRKHKTSKLEYTIEEILIKSQIPYNKNDRKELAGKELDFYIPEKKLGIEANGIYWHSDKFHEPDYARIKHELAESKGIDLIQFTEDDILHKKDIVESIIFNRLGINIKTISARKCTIVELTNLKEVQLFYEQNHLQGFVNSKHHLGLYFENELVAIMSFSN